MNDERFPKAKLFSIRWKGWPKSHYRCGRTWWLYSRCANASLLYFGPLEISWRRSWLPTAAYSNGWDACFRQMYRGDAK